jgi:hypothetical protein
MTVSNQEDPERQPEPVLSTGADAPMNAEQAKLLRELALDALEPEAFSRKLTQTEAAERIAVLKAKLKLMSHPPHTA